MKILKETIKNVQIGFPAVWSALTEDGEPITLSYRHGVVSILTERGNIIEKLNGPKGEFDVGGSMEDRELLSVLGRDGYLAD